MFKYFRGKINSVDATIDSIGRIDNKLPVCNFFDNVILNKPDSIKIIIYSWEGEPIFRTVTYDGKQIKIAIDSTESSPKTVKTFYGDSFRKEKSGSLIEYNLYDKDKFIVRLLFYRN